MKSSKIFFLFIVLSCSLYACSITKDASEVIQPKDATVIEEPGNTMTLTDRLRTLPGVSVVGVGASAKIRIRGNSSLLGDNEPLFVLNDQIVTGGFRTIHSMVNVADVKRIAVLKDSDSTSAYGMRGANGVIKIDLK